MRNPDGSQGYTSNSITGCLNHVNGLCKGGLFPCYAYKLANGRLKSRYLANPHTALKEQMEASVEEYERQRTDPFYPRFWEERLFELSPIAQTHKGIFVCDMGDLFGIGIPEEWTLAVLGQIRIHPEHRFYLLTKQPQNLIKWSPFPENCYVGVTATGSEYLSQALYVGLARIDASIKFVSFEPLLGKSELDAVDLKDCGINWLIIGACTGSAWDIGKVQRKYPDLQHKPIGNKWTAQPNPEWVQEIVEAADKAGVPVFLKDNLKPLLCGSALAGQASLDLGLLNWAGELRQEMPSEIRR